ncbi:PhoX family protein [Wohlfahrtiimonas chitiniclastica]|uniref:PhoX family protein n=1 Tax=Wohlfahrtiimonas chitiniclastica TaxID=400946 RepID=UPI001BD0E208|nr:PhoX family phosphatase [Wohlfahrtiimonas chitiniclastica]MBS7837642.1 PhoX family phosphatase [Wohlfahrtiimonas chitiniclastica]
MGRPKTIEITTEAISNLSPNPILSTLLNKPRSRRDVLTKTGMSAGLLGLFTLPLVNVAKAMTPSSQNQLTDGQTPYLRFQSVPFSTQDDVIVPKGYQAEVLYQWGDPVGIQGNGPKFNEDASNTAEDQAAQAGMHHDGMAYFPLDEGSNHGLLVMNHEYVDNGLLFPDGDANWNADKVLKSQNAMGVSVIEVIKDGHQWRVVRPSTYARRITPHTPMHIQGPAKGHPLMQTAADPKGEMVLGTLQNCANGQTPWGTYLTCEENWSDIFVKKGALNELESRYGIVNQDDAYRWHEFDARFNVDQTPNEPNRFGWIVEIDPTDPNATPIKHTALGRFKHEGAELTIAPTGQIVAYMGDDQRFEYIYKFVSKDAFDPKKGKQNSQLLDEGTLYVARFNEDGSGDWLPLIYGKNGLTAANGFHHQGDVVINARKAADIVGATKMDRPEWIAANPLVPGSIYCTLTNNSNRGKEGYPDVDAANPRANNLFGHIIHWDEENGNGATDAFTWDILALAGRDQTTARNHMANHRGDLFGSPDGLKFDHNGLLWVQTDVSTSTLNQHEYAGMGNNQMLVVDPEEGYFKRFLTGPNGAEITGIAFTPDNQTLFVNIQHPGEPPKGNADPNNPNQYSSWPNHHNRRPRSATVVIQRTDGGIIGT